MLTVDLMESLRASRRQAAAGDAVPLRDQVETGLVFEVEITREGLRRVLYRPR